jgi:hypothetical protein
MVNMSTLPTVIVSEADAVHPLASVTVTVYIVVDEGVAKGQHELAFDKEDGLDQIKLTPPDAVRVAEPPKHIEALGLVLAGGVGLRDTSTESVETHPVTESVTVK